MSDGRVEPGTLGLEFFVGAGVAKLGEGLLAGISDAVSSFFGGGSEAAEDIAAETPKVNMGKQGKHIVGDNNFIEGRSELTADPAELAKKAGTGQPANNVPRGAPGFKERVDFGKVIGNFVDKSGAKLPTTKGMIVYGKDGVHIYPVRP
jgi:filamentous hemagglutinin